MSFESDLRDHLLNQTTVGERIFPLVRPQQGDGAARPAITYLRVAGIPMNDLDGDDGNLLNIRSQVDVWADTYAAARTIADAVRLRMQSFATRTVMISDQDLYEDDTRIFRVSMDFSSWYRTG